MGGNVHTAAGQDVVVRHDDGRLVVLLVGVAVGIARHDRIGILILKGRETEAGGRVREEVPRKGVTHLFLCVG